MGNDTEHGAPVPPGCKQEGEGIPFVGESSVAASCDSRADGDPAPVRRHVHHSYIWLGAIRHALSVVLTVAIASVSTIVGLLIESGGNPTREELVQFFIVCALIGLLFVLAIAAAAVYQVLSYRHLYYTLGDSEFSLYLGIISKKRVHVPYYRVQSVDQRASLFQRIFGVCTVLVDTAGGSSNKAITVPYLAKSQAEWLRTEMFARKRRVQAGADSGSRASCAPGGAVSAGGCKGNVLDLGAHVWDEVGGVFAGEKVNTGRVSFEYGLSNKELLFTGVSNNSSFALVLVALVGFASQAGSLLVAFLPKGSADFAANAVAGVGAKATFGIAGALAGAVFSVLALIWILSAVVSCVGYGGFRARRRDGRVEIERGLLQHTFQGVDVDRVQAVVVKQSFIRRLLGYCELSLSKVDAVSAEEDLSGQGAKAPKGVVIHPFVKVAEVPRILQGLLPEYADVPTRVTKVAPVALRRALVRRCLWQGPGFWLAVAVTVCLVAVLALYPGQALTVDTAASSGAQALLFGYVRAAVAVLYALAVLLTAVSAVDAVLWFRESGFAWNDRFAQFTDSGFTRSVTNIPRQKIQYVWVRTNPFQRMSRVASVHARTAAGVGGTTIWLLDVAREDASAWLDWAQPKR